MKKNRCLCAVTAAVLLAVTPLQAAASYAPTGPGADPESSSYSEEELARMQDNILEYDEIPVRIKEYNPAISDAWRQYNDTKQDYQAIVTELVNEYGKVKELSDSYVSAGKLTGSSTIVALGNTLDSSYRNTISKMRTTIADWGNPSKNNAEIRKNEKMLITYAQQAMIGYDTIRQNIDTLTTMVALYQKQYDMTNRQLGLGLATEQDVLSANSNLLSAQSQLLALQNQQESTRVTLCQMLGYDPASNPDIRPMPEFDMNRIAGMNLEADTKKAIGNNYTLISQRTSAAGKTNAQTEARSKMIDEGDQKLSIEMQRLYQDVMDKKAAYDAAVTGLTAAESSKAAAERQYANGLTSEMQYTGQLLSYYQKRAAKEGAALTLWQSMETYDWAIAGFATVE